MQLKPAETSVSSLGHADNMDGDTWWRIEGRGMEEAMATTETDPNSADRIIESFEDAGKPALESVRRFLDTMNGVFPDMGTEDGPRKTIIDSAFTMTEQLVGTSTRLAERIAKTSQDALSASDKND